MSRTPKFKDDPQAPDLYVDGVSGFFVFAGNIKITVESFRADHSVTPAPINRVPIGRLVMPVANARTFAQKLIEFLDRHEKAAEGESGSTLQ